MVIRYEERFVEQAGKTAWLKSDTVVKVSQLSDDDAVLN
jgi:hypothetical protein